MRRRRQVGTVLVAASLVVAGCSGGGDDVGGTAAPAGQGAGTTVASGAAPTAATDDGVVPSDEVGPYAVGRRELVVVDGEREGRELPTTVWYPVSPDAATADLVPSFYSFVGDVGVASTVSFDDAPAAEGPFPLVVFSHGNGGTRTQSTFLTEALASHGFVVASPDHVGNTAADLVTGAAVSQPESAVARPADVSVVIDELLARAADEADPLAGVVDGERIGVTGHSFGGLTTLAMVVETDGVPADARIDAVAPVAPASFPIGDEALASITTPVLFVGGTLDGTTELDPEVTRPWSLVASDEAHRVDVEGAGHLSFSNLCPVVAEYAASPDAVEVIAEYMEGLADEGCNERFTPVADVHDLTNRFVVAFFQVTLAGDDAYRTYLAPTDGVAYAGSAGAEPQG